MNGILSVSGICKRFNGNAVLDDVSFCLPEREIFGIMGLAVRVKARY